MRVLVNFSDDDEAEFDWQPLPRAGDFVRFEPPDPRAGDYRVVAVTFLVEQNDFVPHLTLTDDLDEMEDLG